MCNKAAVAPLRVNNNKKRLSAHGTRRMCCGSITLMYTREIRRIRSFVTCLSERKYGATWLDLHPLRENWIYRNKKKKNKFLNQLENDVSLITNAKILLYRRRTIVTPFSSTSRANWERFSRDSVFLAKRKKTKWRAKLEIIWFFFVFFSFLASC